MGNFKRLVRSIKAHKEEHGNHPKVRVSRKFWANHSKNLEKLSDQGIKIEVDDAILLDDTFLLDVEQEKEYKAETIKDLKKIIDKLVDEGKGNWPVRNMPMNTDTYHNVELYTIVPGEAPYTGLELIPSHEGAPDGEHVLLQMGS
ncbi:hypothetical protein [Fodinibius halophilus]|uniref:Uncharacterized protein n=1 Tax=Fodinibius halophilus TaxID=1736908 RepID=A0A6M1TJ03_9BACT|nr:hypothetical protein [Fodinibius halophilus]NGP88590.1 hypothetical protein [Fodinibius halophilus]